MKDREGYGEKKPRGGASPFAIASGSRCATFIASPPRPLPRTGMLDIFSVAGRGRLSVLVFSVMVRISLHHAQRLLHAGSAAGPVSGRVMTVARTKTAKEKEKGGGARVRLSD